jgi:hypothetical protein
MSIPFGEQRADYLTSIPFAAERCCCALGRPIPCPKYVDDPDDKFSSQFTRARTDIYTVGWGKAALNDVSGGAAFGTPGQDPESFRSKGINLISSIRTLCRGKLRQTKIARRAVADHT